MVWTNINIYGRRTWLHRFDAGWRFVNFISGPRLSCCDNPRTCQFSPIERLYHELLHSRSHKFVGDRFQKCTRLITLHIQPIPVRLLAHAVTHWADGEYSLYLAFSSEVGSRQPLFLKQHRARPTLCQRRVARETSTQAIPPVACNRAPQGDGRLISVQSIISFQSIMEIRKFQCILKLYVRIWS